MADPYRDKPKDVWLVQQSLFESTYEIVREPESGGMLSLRGDEGPWSWQIPDRDFVRFGSLWSSPPSDLLDAIVMVGSQQQDLVAPAAQNQVEVIEDVAAEDAQVGHRRVGKCSEFTSHVGYTPIVSGENQNGFHLDEIALAGDSLQDHSVRGPGAGKPELFKKVCSEDRTVITGGDTETHRPVMTRLRFAL